MGYRRQKSWRHPALGSIALAFVCLLGFIELLLLASVIQKFDRAGAGGTAAFFIVIAVFVIIGVGLALRSSKAYLTSGTRGYSTVAWIVYLTLMLVVCGFLLLASAG